MGNNLDIMGRISYSAVVLNEKSRERVLKRFKEYIPDEFEIIAHHMTINMGEIHSDFEKYLGVTVGLKVEEIAMDDKVIAIGVSGFKTKNKKPHITLAVNRHVGGKPKMANDLKTWEKLKRPMYISGDVKEVEFKI